MPLPNRPRPSITGLTIESELGRGGSAVVYRARTSDGRTVALKLLNKNVDVKTLAAFESAAAIVSSADVAKARVIRGAEAEHLRAFLRKEELSRQDELRHGYFDREVRIHEALRGKGFVECLDAGIDSEGFPFLILEFMPGGSLSERLRGLSPKLMSVDEVVRLGTSLAESLAAAHALGVVHRDVKAGNVLFTATGAPRISDLGLAKHYDRAAPGASQSHDLSKTGEARGTFAYMAPEQMDARNVGPAADVFALGVVLYECLTGTLPFRGASALEIVARAAQGFYTPPRQLRPEAPKFLCEIIERCLKPDAASRFADGGELARALETHRARQSASVDAGGERPRATTRSRRTIGLLALNAALLVALGTLVAIVMRKRARIERTEEAPAKAPPSGAPKSSPSAPAIEGPRWYRDLPDSERPPYPLPRGITFGRAAKTYLNAKDGSELVFVPAGEFIMGTSDAEPADGPPHQVQLSPYFIGRLEVTNDQFAAFTRDARYKTAAEKDDPVGQAVGRGLVEDERLLNRDTWRNPLGEGRPPGNFPVVEVTWSDAQAYVEWAGLMLPTEAQWERAAAWDPAAKKARRYSWGDWIPGKGSPLVENIADESLRRARPRAFDIFTGYDDGFAGLAPVGSFPAGESPCGALDMTGNAGEWCADGCDRPLAPYDPLDKSNPFRAPGSMPARMARGPGYRCGPKTAAVQRRFPLPAGEFNPTLGLRVALTLVR